MQQNRHNNSCCTAALLLMFEYVCQADQNMQLESGQARLVLLLLALTNSTSALRHIPKVATRTPHPGL